MSIIIKIDVVGIEANVDVKVLSSNGVEHLQAIHALSDAMRHLTAIVLKSEYGVIPASQKSEK